MSRISNRQLVIAFLACRLSSDMITLPAAMVRYGTERFYAILLAKIVLLAVYLPVIFVSIKYKGDSVITAAVRRNKAFGVILGVIMTIIIIIERNTFNYNLYYIVSFGIKIYRELPTLCICILVGEQNVNKL